MLTAISSFGQDTAIAKYLGTEPIHVLTGGVVIVRAQINDATDTLHFILDTGSGGISLDSATCDRLQIVPISSEKTIKGIGGIRQARIVYNTRLTLLHGLVTDSLNFHVNDYEILSSVYGLKIDGIIGYNFLSRYIIKLDYDSSKMHIYSQGKITYPKGGFLLKPFIGIIPILQTDFTDARPVTSRFYFDTGAGLSFLLSKAYVNDSLVMRRRKAPIVLTQAEGVGGKTQMGLTTVRKVKIGPYRFQHVPTFIFEDPYNIISYPNLAGLIGNDLLRRFNTILNYRKREFYLTPNQHLRDVFDYSYTGLGIYFIDGKVVVEDVIPGSPGDQAGFKNGDIIFGIGKNFSNNIQEYKNLLQNTGSKIKLIIIRDGEYAEIILRPKNIMKRR
jgi:predicted aspartyl protease